MGLPSEQINLYAEERGSNDPHRSPPFDQAPGGLAACSGTLPSLLEYNDISTPREDRPPFQECENYKALNANQKQGKRLFSALQSGLIWNKDRAMRFMTLTSSNESPADTMRSFNRLITTMRKTTPARLIEGDYVPMERVNRYYKGKPVDEPLKVEYMAVLTSEGHGVIHALVVGDYLPQKWLSDTWKAIHKAWSVDIRAPKGDNGHLKIARYILAQYVRGQSAIQRVNCSQNWVYPGWRKDFKALVAETKRDFEKAGRPPHDGFLLSLLTWNECMMTHRRPCDLRNDFPQSSLDVGDLDTAIIEESRQKYKEWLLNNSSIDDYRERMVT